MNYIYLLIAIVLYIITPIEYNFSLSVVYLLIFVLSFVYTFRKYQIEYLSFFSLFSFSYFLGYFLIPVLGVPFYPIELIFRYPIDTDYILKGEALALVAYCSITSGMSLYFAKNKKTKINFISYRIVFVDYFKYIAFVFLFIYLYVHINALSYDYGEFNEKVFGQSFMSTFLELTLYIYSMYLMNQLYKNRDKSIFKLLISNIGILMYLIILTYVYMRVGERGLLIKLLLPIIIGYNFIVKKISKKVLVGILILGFSFMIFIRNTRSENSYANYLENRKYELPAYIDNTSDLTCATMTMCLGLEYKEKKGYLYGRTMLADIFSPVPFIPSIIKNTIFNGERVSTGRILSDAVGLGKESGIGTSAVVDVYMNFGVIAVILLFLFFGYIVSLMENMKYTSIYYLVIYLLVVYSAIYIPRDTIFSIIRPFVWGYALTAIFYKRNSNLPHKG
jgi:oligosaccharide repeat unit polymerase